jgi:hypothetical protein
LDAGVLREFLIGLVLIGAQRLAQPDARIGGHILEQVGVEPGNVDGVGLHEAQVYLGRRVFADPVGKVHELRIVDADIEHSTRPAPIRVFR